VRLDAAEKSDRLVMTLATHAVASLRVLVTT
jgi:hypothetical protein